MEALLWTALSLFATILLTGLGYLTMMDRARLAANKVQEAEEETNVMGIDISQQPARYGLLTGILAQWQTPPAPIEMRYTGVYEATDEETDKGGLGGFGYVPNQPRRSNPLVGLVLEDAVTGEFRVRGRG